MNKYTNTAYKLSKIMFIILLMKCSFVSCMSVNKAILNKVHNAQALKGITSLANNFKDGKTLSNVLFLYGPNGNGKTTLAQEFVQRSDSSFIEKKLSEFDSSDIATNIKASFGQAIYESYESNKKVVLYFNLSNSSAINSGFIRRVFCAEIDKIKDNPKVFIILSNEHKFQLGSSLLNRMHNEINVPRPTMSARFELVEHLIKDLKMKIGDKLIQKIAYDTEGQNLVDIKNEIKDIVAQEINVIIKTLKEAKLDKELLAMNLEERKLFLESLKIRIQQNDELVEKLKNEFNESELTKLINDSENILRKKELINSLLVTTVVAGLIYIVYKDFFSKDNKDKVQDNNRDHNITKTVDQAKVNSLDIKKQI